MKFTSGMFLRALNVTNATLAAEDAQVAFDKWLSEQAVVHSSREWEPPLHTWHRMGMSEDVYGQNGELIFARSTHSARLVDIREIKK